MKDLLVKNYKTTIMAILLGIVIVSYSLGVIGTEELTVASSIIAGAGFMVSKDGDKTHSK